MEPGEILLLQNMQDGIKQIGTNQSEIHRKVDDIAAKVTFIEARHKACPGEDAQDTLEEFTPMLKNAKWFYDKPKRLVYIATGYFIILLLGSFITIGAVQNIANEKIKSFIEKIEKIKPKPGQ